MNANQIERIGNLLKLMPRFLWLLLKGLFIMVKKIHKTLGDQYFILMLIVLFFVALSIWALSL